MRQQELLGFPETDNLRDQYRRKMLRRRLITTEIDEEQRWIFISAIQFGQSARSTANQIGFFQCVVIRIEDFDPRLCEKIVQNMALSKDREGAARLSGD